MVQRREYLPTCLPALLTFTILPSSSLGTINNIMTFVFFSPEQNTFQFTLSSFGSIANGAEFLINNCERRVGQFPWTKYYVGGQVFYRDKWNVIVREDKC